MKTQAIRRVALSFLIILAYLFSPSYARANSKQISVDLSKQRIYAYEDSKQIYSFAVSSGKSSTPTPTGSFWPYIKLRYTRMVGGSKTNGTYYNLPNVPYVIYFYNELYPKGSGYALHGTYWHNNFGHPMSHGCINMRTSDMEKLYSWIDTISYDQQGNGSGTMISIFGITPKS